jgi:hypothetical protein
VNLVFAEQEQAVSFERVDASASVEGTRAWRVDPVDPSWTLQYFVSAYDPGTEVGVIENLEEVGYEVVKPIPYEIERIGEMNFLASFVEANIAVGGFDLQDAYQALVAEILDTFDALTEEPRLGPDAAAQLAVLRTYIVRA